MKRIKRDRRSRSLQKLGESSAWCYNLAGVPNTVTMATWSSQSSECITICRSTKKNLWVRPSVCHSMHTDIFLIFFIVWFVGFSKNRVFGWERFWTSSYIVFCVLFLVSAVKMNSVFFSIRNLITGRGIEISLHYKILDWYQA